MAPGITTGITGAILVAFGGRSLWQKTDSENHVGEASLEQPLSDALQKADVILPAESHSQHSNLFYVSTTGAQDTSSVLSGTLDSIEFDAVECSDLDMDQPSSLIEQLASTTVKVIVPPTQEKEQEKELLEHADPHVDLPRAAVEQSALTISEYPPFALVATSGSLSSAFEQEPASHTILVSPDDWMNALWQDMELPMESSEPLTGSRTFCLGAIVVFAFAGLLLLRSACSPRHRGVQVLAVQRQQITQMLAEDCVAQEISSDFAACAEEAMSLKNAELENAFISAVVVTMDTDRACGDFRALTLDARAVLHEPVEIAAKVASTAVDVSSLLAAAEAASDEPLTTVKSTVGCVLPSLSHSYIVAAKPELCSSLAVGDFRSLPPMAWTRIYVPLFAPVQIARAEFALRSQDEDPALPEVVRLNTKSVEPENYQALGDYRSLSFSAWAAIYARFTVDATENLAQFRAAMSSLDLSEKAIPACAAVAPDAVQIAGDCHSLAPHFQSSQFAMEVCRSAEHSSIHLLELPSLTDADEVEWLDSPAGGTGSEPVTSPVAREVAIDATSAFRFVAEPPAQLLAPTAPARPISAPIASSEDTGRPFTGARAGWPGSAASSVRRSLVRVLVPGAKVRGRARGRKPASASPRLLVRKTRSTAFVRQKIIVGSMGPEAAPRAPSPMPKAPLGVAVSSHAQQAEAPKKTANSDFHDALRNVPSPTRRRSAGKSRVQTACS